MNKAVSICLSICVCLYIYLMKIMRDLCTQCSVLFRMSSSSYPCKPMCCEWEKTYVSVNLPWSEGILLHKSTLCYIVSENCHINKIWLIESWIFIHRLTFVIGNIYNLLCNCDFMIISSCTFLLQSESVDWTEMWRYPCSRVEAGIEAQQKHWVNERYIVCGLGLGFKVNSVVLVLVYCSYSNKILFFFFFFTLLCLYNLWDT